MTADLAIFVSKRLQRVAFALICLAASQFVLASCEPKQSDTAVRVVLALPN